MSTQHCLFLACLLHWPTTADLDAALNCLTHEDPSLRVSTDPDTGQVRLLQRIDSVRSVVVICQCSLCIRITVCVDVVVHTVCCLLSLFITFYLLLDCSVWDG